MDSMIEFEDALPSIITDTSTTYTARDPETFYASHLGFCLRQLYLAKLGLRDTRTLQGRFKASVLIQQFFEDKLADRYPQLEIKATVAFDAGTVRFVGRCNCYDPTEGIVYDIKTRNGWYKFNPPIDRHLDQLYVYMRGLNAERGRLAYISKNDLTDIRTWPSVSSGTQFIDFASDRFDALVTKAETIREEIMANGIASSPGEIPFPKCDCYFCESEALELPEQTNARKNTQTQSQQESPKGKTTDDTRSYQTEAENTLRNDDSIEPVSGSSEVVENDVYHVPTGLREFDTWVVWNGENKVALAPWQSGTMYPCEWAADKQVDPRRSFEEAKMVAEMSVEQVHQTWPFPDENDLPEIVEPAVLLPHEPPEPPIVFVDFDDVRDPATGMVSQEVIELLNQLSGYTELSRSETGLHVYVRGRLPDDIGAFSAPLHGSGQIEIYDHSRFTGGTWQHVKDTPLDEVPHAQEILDQIIATYATSLPGPLE